MLHEIVINTVMRVQVGMTGTYRDARANVILYAASIVLTIVVLRTAVLPAEDGAPERAQLSSA